MKKFLAIYLGPSAEAMKKWMSMDEAERKKTSAQGLADTKNNMTGFVIVQAESHDAAARMFLDHPHFTKFPGDSIEIMECLPIPAMPER